MSKLTYRDLVTSNRKDLLEVCYFVQKNDKAFKILSEETRTFIIDEFINEELAFFYHNNIILNEGFKDFLKKWGKKKRTWLIASMLILNSLAGRGYILNNDSPEMKKFEAYMDSTYGR